MDGIPQDAASERINFSVSMTRELRDKLDEIARKEGHQNRSRVIVRMCEDATRED